MMKKRRVWMLPLVVSTAILLGGCMANSAPQEVEPTLAESADSEPASTSQSSADINTTESPLVILQRDRFPVVPSGWWV